MQKPIDIVITWVDGNDPVHKRKMQPYLNAEFGVESASDLADDLAGKTRYDSQGEIFYCVASILRFAPFVRKIFVVTDSQNPCVDDFLKTNFPENKIPVEIIDHETIFKGYEKYLPVFNSLSVETCLYRIPGLSENFVYFNDDLFLVRPVSAHDWFRNDKAVAYGKWGCTLWVKLLKQLKPRKNGAKTFGFKDSMINATKHVSEQQRYFKISHTPHPLKKSVLKNFFTENENVLMQNVGHRFRHETQFNPQALFYMLALKSNLAVGESKNRLLYLKPVKRGKNYVDKKIKEFEKNPDLIFCCIGSLDLADDTDKNKVTDWMAAVCRVKRDRKANGVDENQTPPNKRGATR